MAAVKGGLAAFEDDDSEVVDEENDEKLFNDVLVSIKLWQEHKFQKEHHRA